jgi:preprotein translocase subunit SecF
LSSKFNLTVDSIDSQIIGPSWGEEITRKALYGLFGFLIVVMLYLAMAFESKMSIAAIISVVHDVFITVGIYALVGFEVTPATVIGFLTILGYSLYDTVVVFDKVRENTKGIAASGKSTYSQAANLAVNQTLVRSFNTSLIALLPVGSILFVGAGLLGAGTLKDLSLALFIGLATGTYSSIFIATPILAVLREREPAMQALAKRVGSRGEKGSVTPSVPAQSGRGPRNQPKRNRRR